MEYIYIIFHQQKWGLLHVLVVDKQLNMPQITMDADGSEPCSHAPCEPCAEVGPPARPRRVARWQLEMFHVF